jgi:hypothetical protein
MMAAASSWPGSVSMMIFLALAIPIVPSSHCVLSGRTDFFTSRHKSAQSARACFDARQQALCQGKSLTSA